MVHTFKLYLLMIKWQLLNMKAYLPFIVLVQIILGVGVVYGLAARPRNTVGECLGV